jgi:hypothetical protein
LRIRRGVLIPAFCRSAFWSEAGRDCRAKEFSMIHFVKHPHLRSVEITPPPAKPSLIERLKNNGIFVSYGVVYAGIVAIALYGLLGR